MKKLIVLAFAIFISFSTTAQKMNKAQWRFRLMSEKINGVYIPINIDDAISVLDTLFKGEVKSLANKSSSESDFTGRTHFGLGMWLRNNWGLWGGSRLSVYFNDMKIFHPDDMSGIILDSYYRHVKGQNLDIEGQKEHYIEYWNKDKMGYFQKKWRRIKYKIQSISDNRDARIQLRHSGLAKGYNVMFAHPYGFSSQEEKNLYDKGVCAKGVVKRFKIISSDAYYEVELLDSQYPCGIIIYDGSIEADKDYVRKSSSIAEDKSVFYMKPGERYWFLLDKKIVFWKPE